jgi:hypothetical protein
MPTVPQNNLKNVVGTERKLPYPILDDGTADINGGDLVYWDSANHVVKALDSDANAEFIAGVAEDTSFTNLYGTKKYKSQMNCYVGAICAFYATVGETYAHLDAVGFGGDAQTIGLIAGGVTKKIGYILLRPGAVPAAAVAGDKVEVLVIAQVPVAPMF